MNLSAFSKAHMTEPGRAKGGPLEPPSHAGSSDQRLHGERTDRPRQRKLC